MSPNSSRSFAVKAVPLLNRGEFRRAEPRRATCNIVGPRFNGSLNVCMVEEVTAASETGVDHMMMSWR